MKKKFGQNNYKMKKIVIQLKSLLNWHSIYPPFASMTARNLRLIENTSLSIVAWSKASEEAVSAWNIAAGSRGRSGPFLTTMFIWKFDPTHLLLNLSHLILLSFILLILDWCQSVRSSYLVVGTFFLALYACRQMWISLCCLNPSHSRAVLLADLNRWRRWLVRMWQS